MNIEKSTFTFLEDLKQHNDRDWFAEHKQRYTAANDNVKSLSNHLMARINEWDEIEKAKVFRIYRDVRFSKDKSPYKTNMGVNFVRATALRRGGYYLHIQPGNVFAAGGFWRPESKDLKRIRQELDMDIDEIEAIQQDKNFKKHFGSITGEKLKSSPRGYDKDHPHIEWLRMKQFLMVKNFTDAEILKEDFADKVNETFRAMLPFHNYMSSVLTTDVNGTPIV